MQVALTGGTGFIGRRLVERLRQAGHAPLLLRRGDFDALERDKPGAVVHLAGEPIAQRWTAAAKVRIRDSRVAGTRRLVEAMSTLSPRPRTLVCASAIGYYGNRGEEVLTESSAPGDGFLPATCREWEAQAEIAESLGMRVVRLRTGIVLGRGGGALEKMLPPFRMCAGGRLGSGRQWMSWIHIDDLTGLILHALEHPLTGPLNGVAPNPVTNAEFTCLLGRALRRPAVLPAPAFGLRFILGEMAQILLDSTRVLPKAAEAGGYRFTYPTLDAALAHLI
ncbi:MAG: TIGR01777 family oxidoreductase [Bryobacteraceae bacterium]